MPAFSFFIGFFVVVGSAHGESSYTDYTDAVYDANQSSTSSSSSSMPSGSTMMSFTSDNKDDPHNTTTFVCGEECQAGKDADDLLKRLNAREMPGTYLQTQALIDMVQEKVDYFKTQVDRYRRHQHGGLNRSRRKRYKRWRNRHAQALDVLKVVKEHARTLFEGEDEEAQRLDTEIANINQESAAAAAELASLTAEGVEDSDLTLKEQQDMAAALGKSGPGSSGRSSGSGSASRVGVASMGGRSPARAAGGDTTVSAGQGIPNTPPPAEVSLNKATGGGIGAATSETAKGGAREEGFDSRGNTLTAQEANGYQTLFKGVPIGIAGASLFGIVQQTYKDKDKSQSFFRRER